MAGQALTYGDKIIPFRVVCDPSRTSRIAIHVDPDGSVIVDAPSDAPDELIHRAVRKRARWIVRHVEAAENRYRHVQPREYVSGEQVLYLGRRYVLKVIISERANRSVKLAAGRLEVRTEDTAPGAVRARLRAWYRFHAQDYFHRRIGDISAGLPWVNTPPPLQLLEMTRQWGSCSTSGQIILNPHLVKAPREAVDYVIIHELIHIKVHDHSPEFTALLGQYMPDWRSTKRSLDAMVEVFLTE